MELLRRPANGGWNFVLRGKVTLYLAICHAMKVYGLLEA